MNQKIKSIGKLFFLVYFLHSNLVFSDEYPTLINPDGSFQFREFTNEQKKNFEFIKSQAMYFHNEISKFIPFLLKEKKFKDNQFTRQFRNYVEVESYTRKKYFVVETFTIKLNGNKIQSIDFKRNKALLESKMDPETIIKSLSNDFTSDDYSNLNLKVETFANYIDPKTPITKNFFMKEIISPIDRIKVLRAYRNKTEEALRELDKIVDIKAANDNTSISNTLKEIEVE